MSDHDRDTERPTGGQLPAWDACADLGERGTWLLEASAGTGKTWQLASLVARLVVEYTVPIQRILVITFTTAATAELRGRIRARLAQIRDTLGALLDGSGTAVSLLADDPVLARLCSGPTALQEQRLTLAKVALSSFDLAPISTIHGFCQRVLDAFAFESGQDAGLTLLQDLGPLREQLVSDALATVQANASALELQRWRKLGWTAKTLNRTVQAATSVSGMAIEPEVVGPPIAIPAALHDAAANFRGWWRREGADLVARLKTDIVARRKLYKSAFTPELVGKWAEALDDWCEQDAPLADVATTAVELGATKLSARLSTLKGVTAPPFADVRTATIDSMLSAGQQAAQTATPLAAFARDARRFVREMLVERRALTFDAMLTRLAEALTTERERGGSRPLADAIAQQFDAAFVDEFQDTDLAQWHILRDAFAGRDGKRLFLIGDPKQAIYAFRGADVFVYLAAKAATPYRRSLAHDGGRYTMTTNWRSDGPLVAALERLWVPGSRAFGELDMDFVAVDAAPKNAQWALAAADKVSRPQGAATARRPLEIRWLDGGPDPDDPDVRMPIRNGGIAADRAAASCAWEIEAMLQSETTLPARTADGVDSRRRLQPGDFAVLVNKHDQAARIKQALSRCGIMSIRAGKDSVFAGPVTDWLLQLLDAVAEPAYEPAARAIAVCPLFGYTLAELATALQRADQRANVGRQPQADDGGPSGGLDWDRWRSALQKWQRLWQKQRFIGVIQPILAEHDVIKRLLGYDDGERLATDLRHLIELCHLAERQHHLGPAGLADWLRKQRLSTTDADAHSPRLESDADAVQIVTIFKAKGLQYPIVMLPFAGTKFSDPGTCDPIVVHPSAERPTDEAVPDGSAAGSMSARPDAVTDLHHVDSPVRKQRVARYLQERRLERMRLLYVAMTRAEHHCVVWAGPLGSASMRESSINALLLRDPSDERDIFTALHSEFAALVTLPSKAAKQAARDKVRQTRAAACSALRERLEQVAHRGGVDLGWRYAGDETAPPIRWDRNAARSATGDRSHAPAPRQPDLELERFDHRTHLYSAWQRASYSSMHAGRSVDDLSLQADKHRALHDEDLRGGRDDDDVANTDPPDTHPDAATPESLPVAPSAKLPLAQMWGGTTVGTWTHAVLEQLEFGAARPLQDADFSAWKLHDGDARAAAIQASPFRERGADDELRRSAAALAAELGAHHGHRRAADHDHLVLALPHILRAPLADGRLGDHALRDGFCLGELAPEDRVDELAFDLSLMGGEDWRRAGDGGDARIDADAVTAALSLRLTDPEQAPGGAAGWDGVGWLRELVDRTQQADASGPFSILPRIAGLLTGFIDLTFRARCRDGRVRYFIADYKTNKLTTPGDRQTRPGHYTRPWLAWSMAHSGYHLQGLLYSVAMHRFLRERVVDYDYDSHFGGHLYLYVRGMAADDRGGFDEQLRGVYADRWPREVIEALDAALDPALVRRRGGSR